jgi:hypothetical protein
LSSSITIKEQTRNSIDSAAIKAHLGDDVKNFMKQSSFTTIRVTTKEDRERSKKYVK